MKRQKTNSIKFLLKYELNQTIIKKLHFCKLQNYIIKPYWILLKKMCPFIYKIFQHSVQAQKFSIDLTICSNNTEE